MGGAEMSERCAKCGAVLLEGKTCQALYDECLSFEYSNAALRTGETMGAHYLATDGICALLMFSFEEW
jgi:hypothetical protein